MLRWAFKFADDCTSPRNSKFLLGLATTFLSIRYLKKFLINSKAFPYSHQRDNKLVDQYCTTNCTRKGRPVLYNKLYKERDNNPCCTV